jgi:hypothetical protein
MSSDPILAAIAALDAKLSGRMEALEGEVRRLRGDIVEKFESVEDKLSLIREDIGTTTKMASTAIDRVAAARREDSDVLDIVVSMNRQIARLRTDVDELKAKGAGT